MRFGKRDQGINGVAQMEVTTTTKDSKNATAKAKVKSTYTVATDSYVDEVISQSVTASKTPLPKAADQEAEAKRVLKLAIDLATKKARAEALRISKDVSKRFEPKSKIADGTINPLDKEGKISIDWLNAYNAPHWMDIGPTMQSQNGKLQKVYSIAGWNNRSGPERYGTSWQRDLLMAKQYAPKTLGEFSSWFNASVDANYVATPTIHASHGLGMAFDLGVSNYIGKNGAQKDSGEKLTLDEASLKKTLVDSKYPEKGTRYDGIPDKDAYEFKRWSLDNALYLASLLPEELDSSKLDQQATALRDFFSMYAVTQKNAGGVWQSLPVKNGDKARAALFGSGDQVTGAISSVFIGGVGTSQNPYRNINDLLAHLGIKSSPYLNHQHHFHVNLRPPIKPVEAKLLLAETAGADMAMAITPLPDTQVLLDDVQSILEAGEELMFSLDMPTTPPETPVLLAQAPAIGAAWSGAQPDFLLKECQETESTVDETRRPGEPRSAMRSVDPAYMLKNYLQNYKIRKEVDLASIKTTLIEGTKHGVIIEGRSRNESQGPSGINYKSRTVYSYDAIPDYEGCDRAVFMAEYEGKHYKIIVDLRVFKIVNEYSPTCPQPQLIKIKKPRAGIDVDGFTTTIADLPGSAVAQTIGTAITLDTNAAGYNWFIDYTPSDNAEFLPTANPNEWIAKADSEAAGKMDMLSVLLHEYGHSLGIEHSANAHDYMATTLAPGVRRMPSADELALMAKLAGDLRLELAGDSTPSPDTPSSPLPSVPLGGSLGLALLGRLRGNRYGGWNVAVDSVSPLMPLVPQYAVAANPKLSNTEFAGEQGWSTTGDVRFQDGAATLTETAASQTRLNQVFIVGENDRFLSFTVADTALDDADQAPDDAFEVALLDANTGASLLGGTGLTRNDAFLNLQADGNEHKSQAVTSIRNADGSRTYLVDLAGIPAGTAVNLAFDLIGFGKGAAAASSHLTIRDLRIGVPQTKDDSATLAEDGVTTIAALANDLNAQQPGFAPIIVDAPVHGQITINADGTFSFAPEKDWHGEDHFSYKLSDGHVDSNLATVSLTVTPVNDAPVAAHDAASVGEDGTIAASGDLLANDRTWAGAGGQRAPAALESRRREASCQGLSAGVVQRRCQPYRHRLV